MRDRVYVDRVPEYEVRDGVVCVDLGDWSMHVPLRVFRLGMTRAMKALREHDATGKVLPFKGGG